MLRILGTTWSGSLQFLETVVKKKGEKYREKRDMSQLEANSLFLTNHLKDCEGRLSALRNEFQSQIFQIHEESVDQFSQFSLRVRDLLNNAWIHYQSEHCYKIHNISKFFFFWIELNEKRKLLLTNQKENEERLQRRLKKLHTLSIHAVSRYCGECIQKIYELWQEKFKSEFVQQCQRADITINLLHSYSRHGFGPDHYNNNNNNNDNNNGGTCTNNIDDNANASNTTTNAITTTTINPNSNIIKNNSTNQGDNNNNDNDNNNNTNTNKNNKNRNTMENNGKTKEDTDACIKKLFKWFGAEESNGASHPCNSHDVKGNLSTMVTGILNAVMSSDHLKRKGDQQIVPDKSKTLFKRESNGDNNNNNINDNNNNNNDDANDKTGNDNDIDNDADDSAYDNGGEDNRKQIATNVAMLKNNHKKIKQAASRTTPYWKKEPQNHESKNKRTFAQMMAEEIDTNPYECPYCPEKYSSGSELRVHESKKHSHVLLFK
ncbi:hypothetical protein RFI_04290, partial [Reticulomyxa filosa]